ncbi:hypothetical protein [Cohnella phaseoli]|uniref:Uncharacterized protein n=1 Tax=Cohnella phaseoli TaxID=456490 RepID=A0A3D9KM59_9BACL|nr:hypothetical protein [Cohnella phaseoli]RED87566.1 hypothetical protein DFP98_10243 [Cohnella phaseoli]
MNFNLLPAPMGGGFRMEGYWVWCGSVVKDEEGRFHMFASRWPTWLPMHPGWIVASEIVRAVADTPEGPYHFQEVVLPANVESGVSARSIGNAT